MNEAKLNITSQNKAFEAISSKIDTENYGKIKT